MAKGEIYTVLRGTPTEYHVVKMTPDQEVLTTYKVQKARAPHLRACDCFAGSKSTCRHREMVQIFIDANAIDSRRAYEFDKKKWVFNPPISTEEP